MQFYSESFFALKILYLKGPIFQHVLIVQVLQKWPFCYLLKLASFPYQFVFFKLLIYRKQRRDCSRIRKRFISVYAQYVERRSWSHSKMLRCVASILRLILVRDSTFFVLLLLISGDVWLLVVKYDSKELIVCLIAVFRGYRFLKLYFRVLKYHFYI